MNTPPSPPRVPAAERWLRVLSSLMAVQPQGELQTNLLTAWAEHFSTLKQGSPSSVIRAAQHFPVGVTVNADRSRMAWTSTGAAGDYFPLLISLFDKLGASDEARLAVSSAGQALRPEWLGSWIEATPGGVDLGWFFLTQQPLVSVAPHLPAGAPLEALLKWGRDQRQPGAVRIGRSLAEPTFGEVQLLLDPGIDDRAELADSLCNALDLPVLPGELLALAESAGPGDWLAMIWLTERGIVKVGIDVPSPGTEVVLRALDMVGVQDDAGLARLEGTLGGSSPAMMELQLIDGAPGVELQYVVTAQG